MASVSCVYPPKLAKALGHSRPGAQAAREFALYVAIVVLSLAAVWQLWRTNVWGYAALLSAIYALLAMIDVADKN